MSDRYDNYEPAILSTEPYQTTIEWIEDWDKAPKDEKTKILVLLKDGNITTGCFYWYTESDHESIGRPIAYWSLQDLIRDTPLDEDGPIEKSSLKWASFP